MICSCGATFEVYDEMMTVDRLIGEWEGKVYRVIEQKDTGVCDILSRTLVCTNGHDGWPTDFDVEY